MRLRPTSFWIDSEQEFGLIFEPSLLAWTYHLDSVSPLVTRHHGMYWLLAKVSRSPSIDPIARTIGPLLTMPTQ